MNTRMTIATLIAELSQYPADLNVVVFDNDGNLTDVSEVVPEREDTERATDESKPADFVIIC